MEARKCGCGFSIVLWWGPFTWISWTTYLVESFYLHYVVLYQDEENRITTRYILENVTQFKLSLWHSMSEINIRWDNSITCCSSGNQIVFHFIIVTIDEWFLWKTWGYYKKWHYKNRLEKIVYPLFNFKHSLQKQKTF